MFYLPNSSSKLLPFSNTLLHFLPLSNTNITCGITCLCLTSTQHSQINRRSPKKIEDGAYEDNRISVPLGYLCCISYNQGTIVFFLHLFPQGYRFFHKACDFIYALNWVAWIKHTKKHSNNSRTHFYSCLKFTGGCCSSELSSANNTTSNCYFLSEEDR